MTSHDMSDIQVCERVIFSRTGTSSPTARPKKWRPHTGGVTSPECSCTSPNDTIRGRLSERPPMTAQPAAADRAGGPTKSSIGFGRLARRHAYVLWRSPHRLFDVTLWPLVDVVLFVAGHVRRSSSQPTTPAKASGYLLAGIVLWHVIYQSQIAMSTGLLGDVRPATS